MEENDRKKVREALLKRATGYDYEEREIIVDKNNKNIGKAKVVKKHIPPDVAAIKIVKQMIETGRW